MTIESGIGMVDSSTMCLGISAGQRVRISTGLLEGLEAVVIGVRYPGRVVLQLQQGLHIHIGQVCLEQL